MNGLFAFKHLWMLQCCILVPMLLVAGMATGCTKRKAVDQFPPGVLRVRYMPAIDWTDCMVASTVMCANYVTN